MCVRMFANLNIILKIRDVLYSMASILEVDRPLECVVNSKSDCDLIKLQIDTHYSQLHEWQKYINSSKKEIIKLKKELYTICKHSFKRDESASYDDIFKYKCTNCNLYKNHY